MFFFFCKRGKKDKKNNRITFFPPRPVVTFWQTSAAVLKIHNKRRFICSPSGLFGRGQSSTIVRPTRVSSSPRQPPFTAEDAGRTTRPLPRIEFVSRTTRAGVVGTNRICGGGSVPRLVGGRSVTRARARDRKRVLTSGRLNGRRRG